jgi:zinc/manganese transport system ATP-binding protein
VNPGPVNRGPVIRLESAGLRFGSLVLWEELTAEVGQGEFLAVLGPNGAGKTTLLKVLLGSQPLTSGTVEVAGAPPGRAGRRIGYVPQQRAFDPDLPLRGRDLVRLGLDGHRPGLPLPRTGVRRRLDEALGAVGATAFADAPVGALSGGEQQRLRIAQALMAEPALLLCDEPLLSLDPAQQQIITALLDRRRRDAGTSVVFVTHEINPILPYADQVLYLVGGQWRLGPPAEVLTTESLSALYGTRVEVLRVGGRIVVAGADDAGAESGHHHRDDTPAGHR